MKHNLRVNSALMLKTLSMTVLILLCLVVARPGSQTARAAATGESLFNANCVVCHKAGGNIINPKKPVIGSTMLASKKTFKSYLLKPSGAMQPCPKIANEDADLAALYDYCKSLK
ncbi:MAG: cytochrome c [Cyanobacteria bacterium REEB67]|nr:cytochrome c [Cyanobacteria bacterium REEB67]